MKNWRHLVIVTLAFMPFYARSESPPRIMTEEMKNRATVAELRIGIFPGCDATLVNKMRVMASGGNAYAQTGMANLYRFGYCTPKDLKLASNWYRKAAEQGDMLAQRDLADFYRLGKGVPENYVEAVKWFRKASEQGDSYSQLMMSIFISSGEGGTPKNQAESFEWCRKSAEQGNVNAQARLGLTYVAGIGTNQDLVQGVKWLIIAKENGDTEHHKDLERYESISSSAQVALAKKMAAEWWEAHNNAKK